MIGEFLGQIFAIADVEVRKVLRDPTELFSRAIQPILWLAVFGRVFGRVRGIPTGDMDYTTFLAPGILAQSILFSAIFYGIGVIWERDLGIVQKLLVSPAYRGALVAGKALAAGLRGLAQAALIYLLAALMGVRIQLAIVPILGVLLIVVAGSAVFATFSLMVACIVKTRERFMGIGQLLTMPLFFASNAIYPLSMMPGWLKVLARLNPLTYIVDALRELMVAGGVGYGFGFDLGVTASVFVILLASTTRLYPTITR